MNKTIKLEKKSIIVNSRKNSKITESWRDIINRLLRLSKISNKDYIGYYNYYNLSFPNELNEPDIIKRIIGAIRADIKNERKYIMTDLDEK